jgi:hypothetical protein
VLLNASVSTASASWLNLATCLSTTTCAVSLLFIHVRLFTEHLNHFITPEKQMLMTDNIPALMQPRLLLYLQLLLHNWYIAPAAPITAVVSRITSQSVSFSDQNTSPAAADLQTTYKKQPKQSFLPVAHPCSLQISTGMVDKPQNQYTHITSSSPPPTHILSCIVHCAL